jgi:hypothetical protein
MHARKLCTSRHFAALGDTWPMFGVMFAALYIYIQHPCEVNCERVNIKAFQEQVKEQT